MEDGQIDVEFKEIVERVRQIEVAVDERTKHFPGRDSGWMFAIACFVPFFYLLMRYYVAK